MAHARSQVRRKILCLNLMTEVPILVTRATSRGIMLPEPLPHPGVHEFGGIVTKTRKVVASGLVTLLASATLAACGDAPEEDTSTGSESTSEPAVSDFQPCIVSDAGGFDDKSFNQLGFEGAKQAADELGVELIAGRVQQRERLRPQPGEPGRRGLRRHRHGRLRAGRGHQGVGCGQPRHRVRPHRRLGRRRRRRCDLRRQGRRGQHQAAPLQHRPGRVPGRLRRC